MKKYGYFGEGLEGYMHYKLAFDRNFADKEEKDLFDDYDSDYSDDFDDFEDYDEDDI